MKIVFDQLGEFEACRAAEQWCDERGIAAGAAQAGSSAITGLPSGAT